MSDALGAMLTPPSSPPRDDCKPAMPLDTSTDLDAAMNDIISFEGITKALKRARTPPPESLPPTPMATPYHSHPASPSSSRGPSPFGVGMLNADPFADLEADDDFLRQMLATSVLENGGAAIAHERHPLPPMAAMAHDDMHTGFDMGDYAGLLAPANSPTSFLDADLPIHDVVADEEAHAQLEALLGSDNDNDSVMGHGHGHGHGHGPAAAAAAPPSSVAAPPAFSSEVPAALAAPSPSSASTYSSSAASVATPKARRGGRPAGSRSSTDSDGGAPPAKRNKVEAVKAKRESHNTSERQRRQALKKSFEDLRVLIPRVASEPRIHTGQILKAAIDYVSELRREEASLAAAKAKLKAQNRSLKARAARR